MKLVLQALINAHHSYPQHWDHAQVMKFDVHMMVHVDPQLKIVLLLHDALTQLQLNVKMVNVYLPWMTALYSMTVLKAAKHVLTVPVHTQFVALQSLAPKTFQLSVMMVLAKLLKINVL